MGNALPFPREESAGLKPLACLRGVVWVGRECSMKFAKTSANIWSQAAIGADLQFVREAPPQEVSALVLGNFANLLPPQNSQPVERQAFQVGELGFNSRIWNENHDPTYGTIL